MASLPGLRELLARKGRTGRNVALVLIGLLMVVGGLYSGVPGSGVLAPTPFGHALGSRSGPSPLAWVPLSMSGLGAATNPDFLGSATTISVTVSGGLPYVNATTLAKTYAYSWTGLPTGCTGGNVSSFSCDPTAVGNFTIVLTVHDAGVNVSQNAFTFQVHGLEITSFTASPTTVSLGSSVTLTGAALGASGAITWNWTGLPAGCTAPASSTLTCVPTAAGSSSVTLRATDTANRTNTRVAGFTVTPVRVTSFRDSPTSIYTGQTSTFYTTTTGTTGAISYTYTGLPGGSSTCLSQNTATLSCIPRVPGTFTVTVTAKDSAGDVSSLSTTLTVKPLTILAYSESPNPTYESLPTTFRVSVAGYLGAVVGGVPQAGYPIYAYSGLPLGCHSVNASILTCRPASTGSYTVEVHVSDPTGNVTTSNVTFQVYADQLLDLYTVESTQVNPLPQANQSCVVVNNSPFWQSTCYPQEMDPSLVSFANGTVGLAYSQFTTQTTNPCAGASVNTVSRVMFATSPDNGTTFGQPVNLGPTTCKFLNAIEPSFAANSGGDVYGVFVMENSSTPPGQWGNRTSAALGFVSSTNGGATFSAVSTITAAGSANLARPEIAVIGTTIYLVFENLANGSTPMLGTPYNALPISVEFMASTNGGGTWTTPISLPSLNSTNGYNAMSPSIAVSAKGEVAVAYATDRSCLAWIGKPYATTCTNYGSEVVAVTSSSNGTTWSAPSVASRGFLQNPTTNATGPFLGETTCDTGTCLPFFFQSTPETAIAFNPNGSDLFVAWAGTLNNTVTLATNLWWRWTGVGVSGSSNNGGTWTGGLVAGPNWGSTTTSLGNRSNYYRPALGVEGSWLYLSYTEDNETNTTFGIGASFPGPFDNSFSQWGVEARIGSSAGALALKWNATTPITVQPIESGRSTNFTANSFTGYVSSLAFSAAGVPITSYALAQEPVDTIVSMTGYYAANTSYATDLEVAGIGQAGWSQVVNVIVNEQGLPSGSNWTLFIDGQNVTSSATSLLLPNIPYAVEIFQKLAPVTFVVPWGEQLTQPSIPSTEYYYGTGLIAIAYSFLAYYNLSVAAPFSSTTTTSCNPTSSYCYIDTYTDDSVVECLPVAGYTCSTAPATATMNTECSPYGQVGCYELYYYTTNDSEVGPNNYNYQYLYTYERLYTEVPGAGFQQVYYLYNYCYNNRAGTPGCQYAYAAYSNGVMCPANVPPSWIGENCTIASTAGAWLPLGFKVTAGESGAYTDWISGFPNYPTYFNGTGSDAYNGPASGGCLHYYGYYNSLNQCPIPYFQETFWGYYGYYQYLCNSYYGADHYFPCWGSTSPIVIEGPVNETAWNIPTGSSSSGGGGGTTVNYPLDVIPGGLPSGTHYSFSLGASNYSAVAPASVMLFNAPPGTDALANGTANATGRPGWVYYAPTMSVNVPDVAIVDLNFTSLVNASAPARVLTIHGTNLSAGTPWSVRFNGTLYRLSGSDANISARPGYYAVSSVETGSPDGQTEYFPQNPVASVNFSSSSLYNLSFVPYYKLWITSSTGGNVQIGTGKPGPGAAGFYKAGVTVNVIATPSPGYEFLGFTGTGAGSFTGNGTQNGASSSATVVANAPIQEGAAFGRLPSARYSITFGSNLPNGVQWTVFLDNVGFTSNLSVMTVGGRYPSNSAFGNYSLMVGNGFTPGFNSSRYVPGNYPTSVGANPTGGLSQYNITFTQQFQVSYSGSVGGTLSVSLGSAPESTSTFWADSGQLINAIATPEKGYRFLGWNGTGNGSVTNTTRSISFHSYSAVSEVASFLKIPYQVPRDYVIGYTAAALLGSAWTLSLTNKSGSTPSPNAGTWHFSTVTGTLDVSLPNGTYTLTWEPAFNVLGTTSYVPLSPPSQLTIAGKNASYPIAFTTRYWVSVGSSSWGAVSATLGKGSTPTSLPGWFNANTVLNLAATPNGAALFEGWSGNAYNGTNLNDSIVLTEPVNELAQFAPPAPPVIQKGGVFSSPLTWAALGAVGLAVGVGVALLMWSRRRGSEPAATTWEAPADDSSAPMEAPPMEEEGSEPMASDLDPGADQ